jgi:glycosyltransferase involved in cell wall biosynthesis
MRVTISMPCYRRPQRTIRAIESICNQNINGWEALVVGDGCPYMMDFILSSYFADMVRTSNLKGNSLKISNHSTNKGGWGYSIINSNISKANGEYFVFMSNDDVILTNHLENYLSGIEGTDLNFAYYDTYIEPTERVRVAELKDGSIGHSELIVKTEFLRQMPPHDSDYGHDWRFIQNMFNATSKHKKIEGKPQTYIVKGVGELRDDIID